MRQSDEVIPFPVSDKFLEVDTFLQDLCHAVRPEAHAAPLAAQVPAMPGLRRVILEDIGPFERLEVDAHA